MIRRGMQFNWRAWVIPLGLLAAAECASLLLSFKSDALAAPSRIAVAYVQALLDGELLRATGQTLTTALVGLLIGGTIGTIVGAFCGLFKSLDRLLQFPVEALRPVPSIALLPIAMLIFGFGYRMEISIVAFATIWPMLILSRAATATVEPRLLEVASALGFKFHQQLVKIIFPAALPRLFVALRVSIGIALVVAVTVEVAGNSIGLGYAMTDAQQALRPGLTLAFLLWIGVIGWALNSLLVAAQRRFFARSAASPP